MHRTILTGSVPRFTTDARFRGCMASRLWYFRKRSQWLVLDLRYGFDTINVLCSRNSFHKWFS